jgi:2-oxoglutarate dehydrogenase E1 component
MIGDTHFQRYLPEPHPEDLVPAEQIRRHILCTGKSMPLHKIHPLTRPLGQVYHTLLQEREDKGIKDVAISRIEQVSPFPYDLVGSLFRGLSPTNGF